MSNLSVRGRNSPTCFHIDLDKAGTPFPVVQTLRHGFTAWLQSPTSTDIHSLTAGSLRGPDAVLTTAFHEQVKHIGWYHLCLGRVSKKSVSCAPL